MIKYYDQKELKKERVCLPYSSTSHPIIKGSQDSNRQKQKQKSCCLLGFFLLVQSACFLIPTGIRLVDLIPVGPTAVSWVLQHQSLFEKTLDRLAYPVVLWRHFLSWECLFPNDTSLYQFDIKLTNTVILSALGGINLVLCLLHLFSQFKFLWGLSSEGPD